jgi:hypothetical protein
MSLDSWMSRIYSFIFASRFPIYVDSASFTDGMIGIL